MRRSWQGRGADAGAAVVDFVLVGALTTLVFVSLIQLALVVHVRNTLIDCASEGARFGAFADRTPADGAQRTRDLVTASLSAGYAADVTAGYASTAGLPTVEVTVTAPVPVLGLIGPGGTMTVRGHGAEESGEVDP